MKYRRVRGSLLLLLFTMAASLAAHAMDMTVTGMVLAPNGIIADGQISVSDQTISFVGPRGAAASSGAVVAVRGIVVPGFVDLHNHLTWNVLPRWLPARRFGNRYEWQDTAEYDRLLAAPHAAVLETAACESEIYAEIKALAGGATSVVGSLLPTKDHPDNADCARGLARNLDLASGLPLARPATDPCVIPGDSETTLSAVVDNEVFPFELSHRRMDFLVCELAQGNLRSLVVHLAEGAPTDSSAHREFLMMSKARLLVPGLVLVHGTALRDADFAALKDRVGLVWSPRSNDELYGATTDVPLAMKDGVAVAIAPDWSPSGSAGMLQEIAYAARRYPAIGSSQLVAMATSVPAKIARVDQHLGSLEAKKLADFIVLDVRVDPNDPKHFDPLVKATPAEVALVVVGGEAVYGDKDLLAKFLPAGATADPLFVCGKEKALYLGQSAAALRHENLAAIQTALKTALERMGSHLPDIECD